MSVKMRRIVSVILSSLLVIVPILGLFPGVTSAAAGVQLTFNLGAQGQTMSNKFYDLVVWDLNDQWTDKADDQQADYFSTKYPFIKRVQLMTATGGCYAGYNGCNTNRDLFVDPSDLSNLTDYKFDTLIHAAHNIVDQGLKPYIVTGNVPLKYSSSPSIGGFAVNVRPPDDYEVYYNYIKAIADALKTEFGIDEVKTWEWGVLTEFENRDWFTDGAADPAGTRTAYFKLYDYTVTALQDAIGEENLTVGAHAMAVSPGMWSQLEFIDHVAKGVNYKTGSVGTQIDFISGSYYDQTPGVLVPVHKSLEDTINLLRSRAIENGLLNLKFGIDEGRILQGPDGKDLNSRVVGHSFQAAADARLFKQMHDSHIDWFSMWGMNTEGIWGGIDSVSTHIASLANRMDGDKQINAQLSGSPNGSGNEIGGIGGYNNIDQKLHLMLYNYNAGMNATTGESPVITVQNIAPAEGSTVTVKQWIVDDEHANFWPAWWSDQSARGLNNSSYNWWSKYSVEVPKSLINQTDIDYWYSREEAYKNLAGLTSTTSEVAVNGGTLTLHPSLGHHGVVFYEITNALNTAEPQVVVDELDNWSKSDAHSAGLVLDTGNADLLESPDHVMRKSSTFQPGAGEYITYHYPGMIGISATGLFASSSERIRDFKLYTSPDGESWTQQLGWKNQDTLINDNLWTRRVYTLDAVPAGTNYFKIEFPQEEAFFYNPLLAQVQIAYFNSCACSDPSIHVDELNDWMIADSHSAGLRFDTGNGGLVNDPSRVMRTDTDSVSPEHVIYRFEGIARASVFGLFASAQEPISNFKFYTSSDGTAWAEHSGMTFSDTPITSINWTNRLYTLGDMPAGTHYLKIEFPSGGENYWNPQLSRVEIQTLPEAPVNVSASAAGMNTIHLSWATTAGASSYNVYRASAADAVYEKINASSVAATTYIDTGLLAGMTYYYKISSVNSAGESLKSTWTSAMTATSDSTIHKDELNDWSVADSHSDGLQFDTGNGGLVNDPSRVMRTNTDPDSAEHVIYRFAGITGASVTGFFSTDKEPINDFKFYSSVDGVEWTAHSGITIADTPITSINWTNRLYSLGDIPAGTEYLKIAFPTGGDFFYNPQLSRVEIQVTEYAVPPAPAGLTASSSDTDSMALSWMASPGADSYNVYRALDANGSFEKINQSAVVATTYTDTGLAAGTTYYYKVTALSSGRESESSMAAVGTTAANPTNNGPVSNGGQSGSAAERNETQTTVSKGKIEVAAKADDKGVVIIALTEEQIRQAVQSAEADTLTIEAKADGERQVSGMRLDIPIQSLAGASGNIRIIEVKMGSATLSISTDQTSGIIGENNALLTLTMTTIDSALLSAAAIRQIGDSPVYDFTLSVDGRDIKTVQPRGAISVSLDYTLGEGAHPEQTVVYFIREDGTPEVVQNAMYDPATGQVTFQPLHFSRYAAAYAEVSFTDLKRDAWAETYIRALAAREIVQGMADGSFQQDKVITRAEFVQMLMKGLNLIDGSASSTMRDVEKGVWYYAAAASAESLGIVQGRSGGTFDATAPITREEMALIAYRAALKKHVPLTANGAAGKPFTDQASISAYAAEAVDAMQQAGVITGTGNGAFKPKATATRAESAAIIYKLLFSKF